MSRGVKSFIERHDWRPVLVGAGICFSIGVLALFVDPKNLSYAEFAYAVAGVLAVSVVGMCVVSDLSQQRTQREMTVQNLRMNATIDNMCQGLCMFDANSGLQVWNQRYLDMYRMRPNSLWVGCTVRDLLKARVEAGTFPLDPDRYAVQLETALKDGKAFTIEVELSDGRMIAVVNQPIEGGGWVATHEDITERVRAEQELSRTRSFLDTIVSNVPMPIVVKHLPDLRYMLVNKAAEHFFNRPGTDFIGKTTHEVAEQAWADAINAKDLEAVRAGVRTVTDEHTIVMPGGDTRIIKTTRVPIKEVDGTPKYMITVVHDVMQRKRDEARISYMTHHDPLTDLPNREAFNKCLAATCELAAKAGEHFALLSIDLDRFQGVNDVFGHSAGDALLRQVAARLQEACQGAFLARAGGDEFVVVSPTGPQPETAENLAARLMHAMADDFDVDGRRATLGLTIGIGVYPQDGADPDTLVANTDAALFRAKSQARGSIRFFEPSMDKRLRDRRMLQHELRAALANEELELHYQPLTKMDGEMVGFEALLRWHHPQRGMVPPSTFIPIAEESGIIGALESSDAVYVQARSCSKPLSPNAWLKRTKLVHFVKVFTKYDFRRHYADWTFR